VQTWAENLSKSLYLRPISQLPISNYSSGILHWARTHITAKKRFVATLPFFFLYASQMSRPYKSSCRGCWCYYLPLQMVRYIGADLYLAAPTNRICGGGLEIRIFSNDLGWKNDQNKSYRSRKVMKLYCLLLFHLKSFTAWKCWLKFNFKIVEELWFLFLISG
jgi:hypothetical protein